MIGLPDKAHYRPATIAKFLDISLSRIYEMVSDGVLPSIKIQHSIRIPRDQFLKWYYEQAENSENKLSA